MGKTDIEWTWKILPDGTIVKGRSWNILRGCEHASTGCIKCYAERMAGRFSGPGLPFEEVIKRVGGNARWNGKVLLLEKALEDPFHWKEASRIFVNSMSDTFHQDVPFEFIDELFLTMATADWHTYIILTKRPARMLEYFRWVESRFSSDGWLFLGKDNGTASIHRSAWPFDNVWLGVSCEDQKAADERIPLLLQIPAVVRFLSCEPLIGPITEIHPVINWVIAGAESGPGARPMNEDWVRSLRDQCVQFNIPFFYKQRAESGKKVSTPELDGQRWVQFPEENE